jgi:hypothetical protein
MLFQEWHDFVTYPLDPNRVTTLRERLDTSRAFRLQADGQYPPGFKPSGKEGVVEISMVIRGDDVFERMSISDYGDVCIWTRDKVWVLLRRGSGGMEKLMYVLRHPPKDDAG